MNRYNIFVKILQDRISKPPVGIDGFAFSKNIVRRYGIFRNSGRLPSLIFLRLFGNRSVNKKNNLNNQIFINNSIKSFNIQYPEVFRQYCSYFPIADINISQEKANISISEQGGIVNNIIKNTISHEHITNKYYETGDARSFPISSTTIRAPGITVNSINPIVSNYLQRFINIKNTGPTFNKPIYPEVQYFAYDDHFLKLLQIIKQKRPIADKNISQETANISIPKQGGIVNTNTNINNTISHEHITNRYYETGDARSFPISSTTIRAPGITVNSINPIVGNYLQRFINIIKTGSKFNKPIYPEIQYFTNEKHLFRLLQIIKKNKSIADKNITQASGITVNSINPIVSNYLQRFINITKTSFKFNKQTYPEIQYFTNENHVFRLLKIIKKNRSIADKNTSQATANISIPKQGRIVNNNINNTIPHEYITNKYYETGDYISFPISSTTVRASGITVNSINPIVSNYLQRFINIRNTGPEFNKPIYPEIQYFTNEKHLFELLQIIEKNRPIIYKNISQKTANISIPKQSGIINNNNINSTIPHKYITIKHYETGDDISFPISTSTVKASGITVNSINPIVSNYLQRFINIRNTGSTFNKPIYPEMQYFANENHLFRLLQIIKQNRSIADKNTSQETANISIPKQGRIVNNTNNTNIKYTIPHEYITNKYYGTGDDISFPTSNTTVRASGITVNSINPIVSNYLQSFINIRNTDSKFNNPIYPEIQYFTNEKHLFKLLQIIKKNRFIEDENVSKETANISNSQQSRIVDDTGLYYHIIKKNSKITNHFQEINSDNNISPRVIHPLIYGLHPSFNEEEQIHKKIFPIQDVDLIYASEPVLNIPTSQNANNVQEKIEKIPDRSINSTRINESLIKESSQHRSVHEIHMIADKVYKIIEKKISIEKDRRGLF
ncbi:MAG: hypothetical protein HF975_07550 [ANME-2 cluster archaeon]|nr:hypothetical protein [ANME-2 cluster archaeon]